MRRDDSTAPAGRPPRDGSFAILVVEDNDEIRQLTATVLAAYGYRVVEARHGEEALERLRQEVADLILLDLNMPVMDGWTFCEHLLALGDQRLASIPILLVTGADGERVRHLSTTRAVGIVKKPFRLDLLVSAIRTALSR